MRYCGRHIVSGCNVAGWNCDVRNWCDSSGRSNRVERRGHDIGRVAGARRTGGGYCNELSFLGCDVANIMSSEGHLMAWKGSVPSFGDCMMRPGHSSRMLAYMSHRDVWPWHYNRSGHWHTLLLYHNCGFCGGDGKCRILGFHGGPGRRLIFSWNGNITCLSGVNRNSFISSVRRCLRNRDFFLFCNDGCTRSLPSTSKAVFGPDTWPYENHIRWHCRARNNVFGLLLLMRCDDCNCVL